MVYILYLNLHHLRSFAVFQKEQKIKYLLQYLCVSVYFYIWRALDGKSKIFYIIWMFDFKLDGFKWRDRCSNTVSLWPIKAE